MSGDEFYDDEVTSGVTKDYARTWHVGDTALHLGEKVMVKADRGGGRLSVEDDEGFAYSVAASDLVPVRQALVTLSPCHWCKRDDLIKAGAYIRVGLDDGSVVNCCDNCWEKRDTDYLTERLDNTDD